MYQYELFAVIFDCNRPRACLWKSAGVVPDQLAEIPPQLAKINFDSGLEISRENKCVETSQVKTRDNDAQNKACHKNTKN